MSAVRRKLYLAQQAAQRNRQFRIDHPTTLNNRTTDIQPDPLPLQRAEMSIHRASSLYPAPDISAGIAMELGKHFTTYKSLKLISRAQIEPTAVFLRSQMFIKKKSNGIITARLAIDGSKQPRQTYNDTYTGTSDTTNRAFLLQAYIADATGASIAYRSATLTFLAPSYTINLPVT